MIIGTVFYMSPEQALGKPVDARTDLFSLGVVLYEAVTGQRPFHGGTATETIMHIVRDDAPLPQGISQGLASIIARCMRKERDERFANAHELSQAFEAQLAVAPTAPFTKPPVPRTPAAPTVITASHPQPRSHTWMWVALVALLVIVAGLSALVISQRKTEPPQVAAAPPSTGSSVPRSLGSSGSEQTVTATPVIEETTTTATTTAQPPTEQPRNRGTEEPPPVKPPPVKTPPPPPAYTADDDYNEGVTHLVERQPMLARQSFESAIAKDPHHARAHFRLGEMALFLRDPENARRELEAARADSDRLDPRERSLTDLGLALLDGDRERAHRLIQEIQATSPADPDLVRFRQLLLELRGEGPRPFRRGRLRPH